MITDYKIIYASEPDDLSEEVKECIAEGYEPLEGGFRIIATYTYRNRDGEDVSAYDFYQVMVKRQAK